MAFDQSTRNCLQKFVNDARNLLSEEFTRQLQATYGLDPKAGSVAAVDAMTHLDNRQRQTAHILRDTLAHYLASTHGIGEANRTKQALSRIVREQAFTVLNRLAALRIAESRGFLLESIAKGYISKGFQLYKQLAGSGQGETGEAYRNYLYSVFDEFSLDLPVLFDRHSVQGRLFPRESALLELLDFINHHKIEPLWAEDETIGWIYQYFNSQEERKKMRAESQAPRNSRELAVRNQFFTPRYVVEFLIDNTLGRIWYEMTQGNVRLVDSCRYLVRRPTEVFLKPGEQAPRQDETDGKESLSQEELLKQPVYIPHRAIKDPRCIRMLDPACGSMHFGLYAFDLFERIYEETWQLETESGAEAFVREGDLKPLRQTYESFEDYKTDIPRLIIEHNIHGVDIDPRAVQIAGLSLWQRAQRAWQQQGIKPQQRPVVRKSNVVCAEPMPGEKALLQEFASSLNPPVLGQLLETIFDKMELAGDAGSLLQIEEEIQSSIHEARDQWQARSGANSVGDMFQAELDDATPQKKLGFDLSGVDDESFWDGAEQLILKALSEYADKAESNADQKRLFAEDAAKGFAFIDLCRRRFDVVLMNPPFGDASKVSSKYLEKAYPASKPDLLAAFIERGLDLIEQGLIGAITARTSFFLISLSQWRQNILENARPEVFADLGFGVMDDALVDAAAYCFNKEKNLETDERKCIFFRLLDSKDKPASLYGSLMAVHQLLPNRSVFYPELDSINAIPEKPFAYWASPHLLEKFKTEPSYIDSKTERDSKCGLGTLDDFRFLRLRWEVLDPTRWVTYVSGGSYSPYIEDLPLVTNWKDNGKEVKTFVESKVGSASRKVQAESYYFMPGFTFPRRTRGFSPKLMPKGCIFSTAGQAGFCSEEDLPWIIPMMSSIIIGYLISLSQGSSGKGGGSSPQFEVGLVKRVPWIEPSEAQKDLLIQGFFNICNKKIEIQSLLETSEWFSWHGDGNNDLNLKKQTESLNQKVDALRREIRLQRDIINALVSNIYGLPDDGWRELAEELTDEIADSRFSDFLKDVSIDSIVIDEKYLAEKEISFSIGDFFGRLFSLNVAEIGHENYLDNRGDVFLDGFSKHLDGKAGKAIAEVEDLLTFIESRFEEKFLSEVEVAIQSTSISKYLLSAGGFFDKHLKLYSAGRRQAPVYWPLQTPSGSYTLWIYYHRLNKESLYVSVNDFVEPKLKAIDEKLRLLRDKPGRNSQEEKELSQLVDMEIELKDFRDELLSIAKFWKPNFDDGVQITAAPLWKLFQHKAWQKKLKVTWESLEKGYYDWAHLACSIWPERVIRKYHQDRSLAISHNIEDIFWHEVEVPVMRGKKATGETKLEWQPKALSDAELNALIQAKIKEMNA